MSDSVLSTPPVEDTGPFARLTPGQRATIAVIALYAISLLAYATAMRGGFIWDDDYYVTRNPMLRSLDGLATIWKPGEWLRADSTQQLQWYPITLTSFWIEFRLWGTNPAGYHIVNVLLHATGAVLLWILLKRLSIPAAWAAAAVFAVHPLHVESVAWITERKNVLSGVFYFLTLLVYFRHVDLTPAPKRDGPPPWYALPDDPTRVYALVVLLFACALLSKSVTASLPAVVLLIIWWKRGRVTLDDFKPLALLFAMGLAMSFITGYIEREVIGANGPAWDYAPTLAGEITARCLIAGRAVWFYATKLFVPVPLSFNYLRWNISIASWWQYLFPVAALGVIASLWMLRRRIGRGPLVCVLFFVGSLVPALGFVDVWPMQYSFVADHFVYLPSIGLIVLTVAALKVGIDRLVKIDALNAAAAPAGLGLVLLLFTLGTLYQGQMYGDLGTLWRTTLNRTGQRSWLAANNYGYWLLTNNPTNDPERLNIAEGWFYKTLQLKPDHVQAHFNLGLVAEKRRDLPLALKHYRNAINTDREFGAAAFKIAETLAKLGQRDDAIKAYSFLAKQKHHGENPQLRVNLGALLADAGRHREAVEQYMEAIRIDPDSLLAHYNLGIALIELKMPNEAMQEFVQVVRIDEKNAPARYQAARLYAGMGRLVEAEHFFKAAITLDPQFIDAHYDLGIAYLWLQRYEEAVVQFNRVLELAPTHPDAKAKLDEALDYIAHPEKRPATRPAAQSAPTTAPR